MSLRMNDPGYPIGGRMNDDLKAALKQAEEQVEKLARSVHYMEEIIILSAISDKHALELQKWIKEYKLDIEQTDAHITEVRTHG